MGDIKIWILSIILGALVTVLWWGVRQAIKGIYARLDKMIQQNNIFGKTLVRQGGEIKALKTRVGTNEFRLNNHAERIRKIEFKQAKNDE